MSNTNEFSEKTFNPFTQCYYCQGPAIPNLTVNRVSVCEKHIDVATGTLAYYEEEFDIQHDLEES